MERIPRSQRFFVCHARFRQGMSPRQIRDEVQRRCPTHPGWREINTRAVFRILDSEAARRGGFHVVYPAMEQVFAENLAAKYGRAPEQILVVDAYGPEAHDAVALKTAELLVSLIRDVARRKRPDQWVCIGLPGGVTIFKMIEALAMLLNRELNLPKLCFHALTAGFDVWSPETNPNELLMYLRMNLKSEKRFVCLHASPVVSAGHYGNLVTLPVVRDAFAVKQDIDIVVTGLAKASDEHGQLRQFLLALGGAGQRSLDGKHWIGEVHCLPYDEKGPVERFAPVRAVTLFEIRELRDLARTKGKYVVVVGGTCTGGPTGVCGQDKAEALHPLLTQDALRFPTHVVTERRTAQKLLDA